MAARDALVFRVLRANRAGELPDDLTTVDVAVLVMLANHHNAATGRCDPSYETLGAQVRKSPATVKRSVKRLRDFGLIETESRRGGAVEGKPGGRRSNLYRFPTFTDGSPMTSPLGGADGSPVNSGRVKTGGADGSPMTQEPPKNHPVNRPKGRSKQTTTSALTWDQLVEGGHAYVEAVLGEGGTVQDPTGLAIYTAKHHPDRAADHYWRSHPPTANDTSGLDGIGDWPDEGAG